MRDRALERESAAAPARGGRSTPAHPVRDAFPPAQSTLLSLQQTAGNAAASSYLSQQGNPLAAGLFRQTQTQARKPHALNSAGVRAATTVDEGTPRLVQAALAESVVLAPYLKGNAALKTIADKTFTIHGSDEEFAYSYAKLHNIRDSPAAVEKQVADVRGFFHRPTHSIHLRPSSRVGDALHEAVHKVSSNGFRGFFGGFLDEGVTQYFTDCVLKEQGLDAMQSHLYEKQLSCAKRLVAFTSRDLVAKAFFIAPQPLVETLQAKLKVDLLGLRKLANDGKLCDRLPK